MEEQRPACVAASWSDPLVHGQGSQYRRAVRNSAWVALVTSSLYCMCSEGTDHCLAVVVTQGSYLLSRIFFLLLLLFPLTLFSLSCTVIYLHSAALWSPGLLMMFALST